MGNLLSGFPDWVLEYMFIDPKLTTLKQEEPTFNDKAMVWVNVLKFTGNLVSACSDLNDVGNMITLASCPFILAQSMMDGEFKFQLMSKNLTRITPLSTLMLGVLPYAIVLWCVSYCIYGVLWIFYFGWLKTPAARESGILACELISLIYFTAITFYAASQGFTGGLAMACINLVSDILMILRSLVICTLLEQANLRENKEAGTEKTNETSPQSPISDNVA